MKTSILLLALIVVALSSCTTAYKTGQTPDDVYYSPVRPQDEYVRMDREDDRSYRYEEDFYEDRYLRMKVRNRYQWNNLNDWYSYERWGYGQNFYYGSYYNPYNSWNYYYNPYSYNTVFVNTKYVTTYNKPRTFNLNTYTTTNNTTGAVKNTTYSNPKYGLPGSSNNSNNNSYNQPRNSTRSSNSGNVLRDIFRGNNSSSSGNSNPSSSSPSSSSSSSSSGSSGGSAPVRRF